jgi:hypothetical protein
MLVAIRRAILMLPLLVVSVNAMADWVEVFRDGAYTVYADPATVVKTGDNTKMWVLYDYRSVQSSNTSKPYRSSRRQSEYDCKGRQSRILLLTGHSGNMAGVDTVFSFSTPDKWEPVRPGSLGEVIWNIACGKA